MEYTTLDKISENLDSMRKPITSFERSVDQDALPKTDEAGNIISVPEKKWKGKEDYLLHFCGLD